MNHRMKKSPGGSGITGAATMLVVFAVVCLALFTALSLHETAEDSRRSKQFSENAVRYYEANREAEEILALLRQGTVPHGVAVTEEGRYTYDCPISDTQSLRVEVSVEGDAWTVHRWQQISTAEWEADSRLPVWNGES